MTRHESTSKRLAAIAGRRINDPDPEVRALAGCVLTQVQAEAAGPKPVKAWGLIGRRSDGRLQPCAQRLKMGDGTVAYKTIRVLITAIPPKPVRKHSAAKGK